MDLQRWLDVIARHPNLASVPRREGLNPFTKEPYFYRAPPEDARVILDGVQVGSMTWAQDGSRQIAVEGEISIVERIAIQVAEELGCVFEPH